MGDGFTNRVDLISSEGKEEWLMYNRNHIPCKDLSKIKLSKGVVMIHRPALPDEKKLESKIVRPSGEEVRYLAVPNCGRVVKVHSDSEYKVGEYVFWSYSGYDVEKPQAISFDYADSLPTYFWIEEKYIRASCPPDKEKLEVANQKLQ